MVLAASQQTLPVLSVRFLITVVLKPLMFFDIDDLPQHIYIYATGVTELFLMLEN